MDPVQAVEVISDQQTFLCWLTEPRLQKPVEGSRIVRCLGVVRGTGMKVTIGFPCELFEKTCLLDNLQNLLVTASSKYYLLVHIL